MPLIAIVLVSAAWLLLAYRFYGRFLARLFGLDPKAKVPAVELRDDVDYVPISTRFLFGQHFSAIAAAGPIVGPILAGTLFGWAPALLWILLGSVFIGGVHDLGSLLASVRHKARSIAEVVRERMNRRSYILFLIFVWIALVYIVVAFTDTVAASFVGRQVLEDGSVISGGGIATSSLLYLALPILMGLLLKYTRLGLGWATLIFLPLVGVAIWLGPKFPFDLAAILGVSDLKAQQSWDVILLAYCFVASIVPMWILLQPRGHLGGYFLLAALAGGMVGIVFGGKPIEYPAFIQWTSPRGETLFPVLFITIACGACSGFHSLVSSGTTSKQLCSESDARPVGYGAMLAEAMVAVVSLCCVMVLTPSSPVLAGGAKPNLIYGMGLGSFLEVFGVPQQFAIAFALLAFTTFVYDTLDVSTRLGRYILQELTGLKGRVGGWIATGVTAATPLIFVLNPVMDASGKPIPVWRAFWPLFGASNQLLAALGLISVTVWLSGIIRSRLVLVVAGLPALWMYVMSMWALLSFCQAGFFRAGTFVLPADPVPWVAALLIALALFLLVEAVLALVRVVSAGARPPRKAP